MEREKNCFVNDPGIFCATKIMKEQAESSFGHVIVMPQVHLSETIRKKLAMEVAKKFWSQFIDATIGPVYERK